MVKILTTGCFIGNCLLASALLLARQSILADTFLHQFAYALLAASATHASVRVYRLFDCKADIKREFEAPKPKISSNSTEEQNEQLRDRLWHAVTHKMPRIDRD